MNLFLRAIITGFAYKLGAELGRFVVEKSGLHSKKKKKSAPTEASATDDLPAGMPPDAPPEDPGEDPDDGEGQDMNL